MDIICYYHAKGYYIWVAPCSPQPLTLTLYEVYFCESRCWLTSLNVLNLITRTITPITLAFSRKSSISSTSVERLSGEMVWDCSRVLGESERGGRERGKEEIERERERTKRESWGSVTVRERGLLWATNCSFSWTFFSSDLQLSDNFFFLLRNLISAQNWFESETKTFFATKFSEKNSFAWFK